MLTFVSFYPWKCIWSHQGTKHHKTITLADLGGAHPARAPPYESRFFHFDMQIFWNVATSGVHGPPMRSTPPPYGKSWIRHWLHTTNQSHILTGTCTIPQHLILHILMFKQPENDIKVHLHVSSIDITLAFNENIDGITHPSASCYVHRGQNCIVLVCTVHLRTCDETGEFLKVLGCKWIGQKD